MSGRSLRIATPNDAEQILSIYVPFVTSTAVSFEFDVPSTAEFADRIANIAAEYPYVVCVEDDQIIGYAYAHRLMERAAYQWDAELSIYLSPSCQGQGVGPVLYRALCDILRLQNIHTVYGIITDSNLASKKMHESFGFRLIGVFQNSGYKYGGWRDVAWYEMPIMNYENDPSPFVPYAALSPAVIDSILLQHSHCL